MPDNSSLVASSLAAWIILPLDIAWCFNAECEWIWKKPPNMIRSAYIFCRTFPILAELANLILVTRFCPPFDLKLCRNWFLFLHSSSACVQVVFTAILYLRTCALHRNKLAVQICSVCAVSVEAAALIGGGALLFFEAEFDAQCVAKPRRLGFALPVVFLANQSIAWGLTWYGRFLLSRALHPLGHTETHQMLPFLPILFRDGSIVLSVAALGFALAVPYTAAVGIQIRSIYPWTMTGLSCFCCHLILNLFRVERAPAGVELSNPNFEMTSFHTEQDHVFPPQVLLRSPKDVSTHTERPRPFLRPMPPLTIPKDTIDQPTVNRHDIPGGRPNTL